MSSPVPFRSSQRVYFDDLDALGILHNIRTLLFVERARGDLFASLGFHWNDIQPENADGFHVVASQTIDYLAPVKGVRELTVEVTVTHLGRSSFGLASRVLSKDGVTVHATARTRIVRLDPDTMKPTSWSERFRAAVTPLIMAPA